MSTTTKKYSLTHLALQYEACVDRGHAADGDGATFVEGAKELTTKLSGSSTVKAMVSDIASLDEGYLAAKDRLNRHNVLLANALATLYLTAHKKCPSATTVGSFAVWFCATFGTNDVRYFTSRTFVQQLAAFERGDDDVADGDDSVEEDLTAMLELARKLRAKKKKLSTAATAAATPTA